MPKIVTFRGIFELIWRWKLYFRSTSVSRMNFQVQTVDFVHKICGFFIRYVTSILLNKVAQKVAGLSRSWMNSNCFSSCVQAHLFAKMLGWQVLHCFCKFSSSVYYTSKLKSCIFQMMLNDFISYEERTDIQIFMQSYTCFFIKIKPVALTWINVS